MRRFICILAASTLTVLLCAGCATLSKLIPLFGNSVTSDVAAPVSTSATTVHPQIVEEPETRPAEPETQTEKEAEPVKAPVTVEEELPANLTQLQKDLIKTAKGKLGCRYQYAGKGPSAFDCSGFTMYVFGKSGIRLVPGSISQYSLGRSLKKGEPLHPCDLVFFSGRKVSGTVGHVGMVLDYDSSTGEFTFIHASCSNGVEIQRSSAEYYARRYIGARRILDDAGDGEGETVPDEEVAAQNAEVVIPQAPPEPEKQWYSVRSGDTLSRIAVKYHTSVAALCRLNGIKETAILQIGQKLRVR
ncbi:MAG: NlpC/P60 family protein [Bacteroidales bacterium]|nr:NlpC/P60 family protein [Bacteroidales bacterium]